MILFLLRGLFIIMAAVVAALYTLSLIEDRAITWMQMVVAILAAVGISGFIIGLDVASPRKKLSAISGVFLGLIVGMLAAYALSFLVGFVGVVYPSIPRDLLDGVTVFIGVICVYGAISLVLQTKDDFRFVIPYVEFTKQIRGPRPMIADTSAIIDGRILDIAETRLLQGLLIIPRFVLDELQKVADSSDKLRRARGRRGLEILQQLQSSPVLEVSIEEDDAEGATVDQKLISLAERLPGRVVTTDFNLSKVADLRGVEVLNINKLAEAVRPAVLPGERLSVQLVKPGESAGQAVGYLRDGTMVVVEQARSEIGEEVAITVTSVLQTSAGRMIFGKLAEGVGGSHGDGSDGSAEGNAAPGQQAAADRTAPPAS